MGKKSRSGFFVSLGFRVFFLTVIILVIPLILYSLSLYYIEYKSELKKDINSLNLILEEEKQSIHDIVMYNFNTLDLIDRLIARKTPENKAANMGLLDDYVMHQDISAISFCKITKERRIICKNSTDSKYKGKDLSGYFSLRDLSRGKRVFIAGDPNGSLSMYVVKFANHSGTSSNLIVSTVPVDSMLKKLNSYKSIKEIEILIVQNNGKVIDSTNKEFLGNMFSIKQKNSGAIILRKMGSLNGFIFTKDEKDYFSVMKVIPQTTNVIALVLEKQTVMIPFYKSLFHLAVFLVLIILIGGFVTYYLVHKMSIPMKNLSRVMGRVGEGEIKVEYGHNRYGFEINVLGDRFNEMRKNLLQYIEVVKIEKGKKEAFEKELQIGHQIQQALLPTQVTIENVDLDTYYAPAKEVAGDFYDYQEIDHGKLLITIADGVGKGVSSCLYSFALRSILKTRAYSTKSIADLIRDTNNIFCKDTKDSCNFVTAVSGILDKEDLTFTFTNAGHLPVFVKKVDGTVENYTTKGIALGIEEFTEVETCTITLSYGDYVVLYTDGVSEAMNEREELFGEDKLVETIANTSASTSKALKDVIMNKVYEHRGTKEQNDDISLVIFKLEKG